MKKLPLFVIALFCCLQANYAQTIDLKTARYWADAGIGTYSSSSSAGFSLNLGLNFGFKNNVFRARFLTMEELNILGPSPTERFTSAGLLVGKTFSRKFFQAQVSGGLGVSTGIMRGRLISDPQTTSGGMGWPSMSLSDGRVFETKSFLALSIPVEVEMLLKPIKYAGLGMSLFGDLNLKRPLIGMSFKLALGKLR